MTRTATPRFVAPMSASPIARSLNSYMTRSIDFAACRISASVGAMLWSGIVTSASVPDAACISGKLA